MKKTLLLAVFAFAAVGISHAAMLDGIAARVDSHVITVGDVMRKFVVR